MSVTVELAENGYIVRVEGERARVIASDDLVDSTLTMLDLVNEEIGTLGSRHDARRIRIIALPGDKWFPRTRTTCPHDWVERSELSGEAPHWWCPCGAEFALVREGRSWEDELASAPGEAPESPPADADDQA